ncbi:hypothetical protein J451_13740 [Mannheimia haemolytica D174]|nr:hypothetical protein J451_13740 [Mannheimia haemolytica D174]
MKDILLDFDDTSCYLGDWEEILEEYNDRVRVEDFWHYAKEFETVPHLGNLYQEHVIPEVDCSIPVLNWILIKIQV